MSESQIPGKGKNHPSSLNIFHLSVRSEWMRYQNISINESPCILSTNQPITLTSTQSVTQTMNHLLIIFKMLAVGTG
jgi:hypothetical protein